MDNTTINKTSESEFTVTTTPVVTPTVTTYSIDDLKNQEVVAEQTKLSATPIEPLPVDKISPA